MAKYKMISGVKRSATEYLYHCFDSHPQTKCLPYEIYLFEYLATHANAESQIINVMRNAPVAEAVWHISTRGLLPFFTKEDPAPGFWSEEGRHFPKLGARVDSSMFFSHLQRHRDSIYSIEELLEVWLEAIENSVEFYSQKQGATWILKCADFGLSILQASKMGLLDRSTFSVRETEEIIDSIKRLRSSETHRDFHFFELCDICDKLDRVPDLLEQISEEILVIRYDEISDSGIETLSRVFRFMEFSPAAVFPTVLGQTWKSNAVDRSENSSNRGVILSDFEMKALEKLALNYGFFYSGLRNQ